MRILNKNELDSVQNINNPRFDEKRVYNYKFDPHVVIYTNDRAYAVVQTNSLGINETYVRSLLSAEKGYGSKLLNELIEEFGRVILLSKPAAGESLLNYYRSLGLNEVVLDSPIYNMPRHFFYSNDLTLEEIQKPLEEKYKGKVK